MPRNTEAAAQFDMAVLGESDKVYRHTMSIINNGLARLVPPTKELHYLEMHQIVLRLLAKSELDRMGEDTRARLLNDANEHVNGYDMKWKALSLLGAISSSTDSTAQMPFFYIIALKQLFIICSYCSMKRGCRNCTFGET